MYLCQIARSNYRTEPNLLEKVSKLMIHRPCHNNRCSKKFLNPYTERTVIDQGTKILVKNLQKFSDLNKCV